MGTGGTGRSTCSGCCPDYIYSDPTGMALQDFCTSIGGSSDPSTHWTNCLLFPFCQWITDPAHPPAGWCSYNGQYQDINCTWFTDEQCNVAENWMTSGGGSGNGAGWCYWSDYPGDGDWYGPCPPHTNCPSGQQWNEASCSCIDAFQATQGNRRGAGISSRRKKMRRGGRGDQSQVDLNRLDSKLSNLDIFVKNLSDGIVISTKRETDIPFEDGEIFDKYILNVEAPSVSGRGIGTNESDFYSDIERAKQALNNLISLDNFANVIFNAGHDIQEIWEKLYHPQFNDWVAGKISNEEFSKVDWCGAPYNNCNNPGPGTCGSWCITGTGTFYCFISGTQITMSDDTMKNIEDIKVDDSVKSWNEETNQIEDNIVTKLMSPIHDDIVKLTFGDIVNGNTFDHPYYVKGKGWCSYRPEWTMERYDIGQIGQLETGDICYYNNDGELEEIKLSHIKEEWGEVQTYVFQVENNTFFANNILTHNKTISGPADAIQELSLSITFWF
jgi:hypothetical protein